MNKWFFINQASYEKIKLLSYSSGSRYDLIECTSVFNQFLAMSSANSLAQLHRMLLLGSHQSSIERCNKQQCQIVVSDVWYPKAQERIYRGHGGAVPHQIEILHNFATTTELLSIRISTHISSCPPSWWYRRDFCLIQGNTYSYVLC